MDEHTKLLKQKTQVQYTDNENEDEIINIARDVNDVSQLFSDVQSLINDQGIVIDDIQTHIENTRRDIETGNNTLAHVEKTQYGDMCSFSDPKLYFIIFLVLILIGFVIYITTRPKME